MSCDVCAARHSANRSCYVASKLSVKDLLEAVRDVPDWHTLGTELGLPRGQLREIEVQHNIQGAARQKSAMFDRWLARCLDASWQKLAEALDRMGEEGAADAVRRKYGIPVPRRAPVDPAAVVVAPTAAAVALSE